MTEGLNQLAFADSGSDQLHSKGEILAIIQMLAIVTLQPLVFDVANHELPQQSLPSQMIRMTSTTSTTTRLMLSF